MALTRAQLLAGNQSQGTVLPGQVQGVTAGAGVTIDAAGVLSLNGNDPAFNGFIKTNNNLAYNAYVWPGVDGAASTFLQTDGNGNLSWATTQGFPVVTISNAAPTPPDLGELWFDCTTGSLKVYQSCVGSPTPNWFDVGQPGVPVDPALTNAAPAFTGGNGTIGTPYQCTVTTAGVGTTVYVVNTVTITGLSPFQYVPIADLNAFTNGGRFTFSNNYANAGGVLVFQTIFNDSPSSTPGSTFTANIKVGYGSAYIDAIVNVVTPLSLPQGTITGTPTVGTAVPYTPATAVGGTGGYSYTYQWFADGVAIVGATAAAYIPVSGDYGKTLSVTQTATDSSSATASATTTAAGAVAYAPFPSGVWNPTPGTGLDTIPGLVSGVYSGTGTPITATEIGRAHV